MRGKVLLLVFGLAIAAGIGLYATHQSHYLLTEHETAYHVSLQQTSDGLNALDQAGQNAVAIALDAGLFQEIGSALVGQKVIFSHPSLPGEVLTATVERVSFTPQLGRFVGNVGLRVASDQRLFSVGLSVESALYFSGVSQVLPSSADRPTTFSANFKLLPMSIEPEIAFGFLNIIGRGFVSDILAGNVVNALSDKLNLAAPYQPRIKYTLDENGQFEQKFGDDNKGTLKYRISHPVVSIERWVHVIAPVFSNRGALLAATVNEKEAKPFVAEGLEKVTDASQISQLEQTLAARIGDAEKYFSGRQMTISIGTGALATVSSGIADALRKLALNLTSTEISGRLFDKRWSDKILGDGGFYAEAAGGDRVHGSITVRAANFSYEPGKGLEGNVGLAISADADIHVHVDPLVGGGMGTTVKLKGSTNPDIKVRLGTSTLKFEGSDVALLAPVLTCTPVNIKVQTDGKLKLGSGWTTVPSIGVITGELVGADPFDPTILSGIPVVIPAVARSDDNTSTDQVVIREGLYLSIEAVGLNLEPAGAGYRLSSDFSLQASNQPPDAKELNDRVQRLTVAAREYWRNEMKPNCPEKPSLRVIVGDLEFGPNNEIIKFIRNAWNDITKGPGKENEIVKLLDRINGSAKDYDETTKKLAGEVGDAARNAFPKNNDIGRAAGEVAKSVTRAATNPVGAVQDLGRQILCGFC